MNSNNSSDLEIVNTPVTQAHISQLQNITLLFFAYRDFIADADRSLKQIAMGRAHHRVLFFVSRKPGMRVADLLQILDITKQSLARVLREMVSSGHIKQITGAEDRRQRLLYPTKRGHKLMLELSKSQSRRINDALANSNIKDIESLAEFLSAMMDPQEREMVEKLVLPKNTP